MGPSPALTEAAPLPSALAPAAREDSVFCSLVGGTLTLNKRGMRQLVYRITRAGTTVFDPGFAAGTPPV